MKIIRAKADGAAPLSTRRAAGMKNPSDAVIGAKAALGRRGLNTLSRQAISISLVSSCSARKQALEMLRPASRRRNARLGY
jgi:hypothetical protein